MSEIAEVTKKDPKRVEAGKKAYEKHLLKVKEGICRGDASGSSTNSTSNTPEADTNSSSSKSYDAHMVWCWSPCHPRYWFACVF